MLISINIHDEERLREAMKAMKPGDQIEIQGSNGSTMSIGVPSLESDEQSDDAPPRRPQGSPDSWLD